MICFNILIYFGFCFLKNNLITSKEIKSYYSDSLLMKNEKVCHSIDVRKKYHLRQLRNCTVIEGNLFLFMLSLSSNPTERYPLLKEITESLLIYHVKRIKNLGVYFPNLSLIRGQSLMYNYALVIKDTSLTNVGLTNLRVISSGGVRIDTNSQLCHIYSVNWTSIVKEPGAPIKIINTGKICPDFCPKNCTKTINQRKHRVNLCWSQKECQTECSEECKNKGVSCYMGDTMKCCHPQCLAGCYGPGNDKCVSCRNVLFEGQCVENCKEGYYKFNGRRCISKEECFFKTYQSILITTDKEPFAIEGNACVKKCSQGKERNKQTGKCDDCGEKCHPKNCSDILIHSISDLKEVEGCYSVKELHINIKEGGEILSASLEKYFSKLTVIEGSIKIIQSASITSLDFLKSLRVIKGGLPYQNGQGTQNVSDEIARPVAFEVYGNENLIHIWRDKSNENQANIKILYGSISFKLNRKLCPEKIMKFLRKNIESGYKLEGIDRKIINVSNGDMAYCSDKRLIIKMVKTKHNSVSIICNSQIEDQDGSRTALFMIKPTNSYLSLYELYNNCYDHGWRIIEGQLGKEVKIENLNPATRYAVYVEAIRSRLDNWLEISDFLYFTTNTTYPSSPIKFRAKGISDSEIKVTWSPPLFPNGIISRYFIWYQKLDISKEDFIDNESCGDKSYLNVAEIKSSFSKIENDYNNMSSNGPCNCNNCLTSCKENQHREEQIANDFGFHMSVYHTMVSLHSQFNDNIHHLPLINLDNLIHNESSNIIDQSYHNRNDRNLSLMYSKNQKIFFSQVSVEVNSFRVKNLQHFSEYLFEIQACQDINLESSKSGGYLCSERSSISSHTLPKEDADNIDMSRTEVSQNHSNVLIKWAEPPNPNGLILYFLIRYRTISTNKMIWSEKCVSLIQWLDMDDFEKNETKKNSDNLTLQVLYDGIRKNGNLQKVGGIKLSNLRYEKYEFQIKSISIAGHSSWSKSIHFRIVSDSIAESYKEVLIIGCVFTPIFISLAIWIIYHYYRKKFLAGKKWVSSNPDYWIIYEIDEWEIKREDVDMIGWNYALGRGSFGLVYKGILKNITTPAKQRFSEESNLKKIFVAVKTLNTTSTVCERREFINEACYMKQFQSFHLVMLFGIVSKVDNSQLNKISNKNKKLFGKFLIFSKMKRRIINAYSIVRRRLNMYKSHDKADVVCNKLEGLKNTIQQHFQKMPLVVMELMENGDLAGYLRKQGEDGDGLISDRQAHLWALQIADGMLYLSDRKFVHRDLATRNCMVNIDIVVKIGDFGMARDVYYDCYYRKKGSGRLPVRWMAPEALRSAYFTVASDVWSFGVVLWEISTLASMPFRGKSHHDVIQFVTNGGNLLTNSPPLSCSKIILHLMQDCWQVEPQHRPSFKEIINTLREFFDENFILNSYFCEKEAQSTMSMEDLSTEVNSNYSKGNIVDQCNEIV